MRDYEAMIILVPDLEEDARTQVLEKIQGFIVKHVGEIKEVSPWGNRRLAYEINDLTDGYYALIKFSGEGGNLSELERNLKIMDEVLRFLIIREGE